MHPELTPPLSWAVRVRWDENGWCEFVIPITKATAGSPCFDCQVFIWCHMFISVPFINTLNKWKCPYSPLLHLNLNAVVRKINSINLAVWGASRKPSWLVMQIKELRVFHCPTHFSQNFAVLPALKFSYSPAGYSPAVEQAEPRHVKCSNLGPGFQVRWSSKISGGGQVSLSQHWSCCGHRSHWGMVSHLKMPIFLCRIAHLLFVLCLFRMSFGLTRRICFFIDFIIVPRDR